MAFVQRTILKNVVPNIHHLTRPLSSGHIEKSVFISQSNDVFTNLAFEEWINTNYDVKTNNIMLYYKNDPCVLIGKDANPWLDTNIAVHPENDENQTVALARRTGKGATLYQDNGMVNFTFFGDNKKIDQDYNLSVIARGIFRKYGMNVKKNQDNLTFYNMKISGLGEITGNENSYQNCSLYVDVNKSNLVGALQKEKTVNAKQNYLNISEIDPKVTTDGLLSAIGWEFLRTPAFSLKDGGKELANKQRGFQMINPTEKWFPGITEIRDRLANWDWCYGSTPKFTILRSFPVPAHFLNSISDNSTELHIKLEVENGRMADISLFVPPGLSSSGFTGEANVVTGLRGQKFSEDAVDSIENIIAGDSNYEKEKFVTDCVRQAMCSV